MTHTVKLNLPEYLAAAICGLLRRRESLHNGYDRDLHCRKKPDETDVEAACAELAVAKFLGQYFPMAVNTFKNRPDIAPDIEVRWTPYMNGGLIVRPAEADNRRFVLVRGRLPHFEIVGWILGSDAKRREWLSNPAGRGQMFLVPAEALQQFDNQGGKS